MSVIRVVARITPLGDASTNPSELHLPTEFGNPISVETCNVTDPRTGLQYAVETTTFSKKYDPVANVSKELSSECESIPGFVCAKGSCPILSLAPEGDGRECATLSFPKSIRRETISQLADEPKTSTGLKLRLNLKKIEKERKLICAQKKSQNLVKPLLRYFIEGECLVCGLVSPGTDPLEHLSTHIKSKSYKCDCCNLLFAHPKSLYLHMLNKTTDCPHSCDICGTKYRRKHLLTVHQLKNHTETVSKFTPNDQSVFRQNVPPCFSCSACEERLMSLDDVYLHKDLHGSPEVLGKPTDHGEHTDQGISFQCVFCGKSFMSVPLLRHHTHIRVLAQRFPCGSCAEEFGSSRALHQHQKMHVKDPWTCRMCGDKKFYFEKTFLKHMKLIHGTN